MKLNGRLGGVVMWGGRWDEDEDEDNYDNWREGNGV